MNRRIASIALACLATIASQVNAQAWPQKSLRILVPSSPGSAPDQITRIVAEKLSKELGQPVIVDNKTGAGGIINMNQLRQAAPDGYTISLIQGAVAAVTPFLYKEATYDVIRDFEVVGTVGITPMMFVANNNFAAKNLSEVVAVAKAQPEKIALGSSTRGSIPNLTNELLAARTSAKFQIVPFSSTAQGLQAVVGGEVPVFVDGVAAVITLVRAGKLRAIATASETVLSGLEGIPLAKDSVPGLNVYGWFAVVAPKGTPKEVIARLNKEINALVQQPDVVEKFRVLGTYPRAGTPEAAASFIGSEVTLFGNIIKATRIKAE